MSFKIAFKFLSKVPKQLRYPYRFCIPTCILYTHNTNKFIILNQKAHTITILTKGSSFFQVVDMRWGVRDEATDDHMTTHLCMQEIDNCQRLSIGPNFIVSNVFIENQDHSMDLYVFIEAYSKFQINSIYRQKQTLIQKMTR